MDLVRDGNDRAFEAIVHRYRRPLQRYCGRYLAAARAEDAVQQTFVNAFGAIRDGDAEINLRPWLYRIAHNASLNVLRQAGADHDEISEQIDGVETPPQALERGERFRSVIAAVRDLPERQRNAIVLQALEGRSYEEIARELGVSGGAVRQLLNRARTTIRETATAVTPPALLARLGGAADAPVAERVAQVVAGAGGGAALAKGLAVLAVAGSVVGGTIERVIPGVGRAGGSGGSTAKASAGGASAAGPGALAAAGGASALGPGGRTSVIDLRTGGSQPGARHGSERVPGMPGGAGSRGSTGDGSHSQQLSHPSGGRNSGGSRGDTHADSHSGDSGSSGTSHDDHPSSSDGSGDSSGRGPGPATTPVGSSGDGSGDRSPAVAPVVLPPSSSASGRGSGKSADSSPEPPEDPVPK